MDNIFRNNITIFLLLLINFINFDCNQTILLYIFLPTIRPKNYNDFQKNIHHFIYNSSNFILQSELQKREAYLYVRYNKIHVGISRKAIRCF